KAWSSFAPPTCRMPLGQSQGIPRAHPGGRVTPRFWHRLNRFRHFCDGSLALASLDRACRNPVPAFPRRSPPRLLTAAASGGVRSALDCRTGRALLHLSYSCAPPILTSALVTHDPQRSSGRIRGTVRFLRRHEHGRGQPPSFGGVAETFDARNRGAQVQAMDI